MNRQISIIIIVILFLLLALAGYFFWWPKFQELSSKTKEIELKDQELKEKKEYLSELNSLSEQLSGYAEQIAKINSALPTEPSAAALLGFLQKTSSENGLILTDIDLAGFFSPEVSEEKSLKIPFSISVSGSYPAFKNFLSAIYKSSRIIEVNTISFSSPGEGQELFDFSLQLETHSY